LRSITWRRKKNRNGIIRKFSMLMEKINIHING
jgi:hypothetical protein